MNDKTDSHKEIACDFDWESVPASQEIRVVRREFPRPFFLAQNPQILRDRLTHSCVSRDNKNVTC